MTRAADLADKYISRTGGAPDSHAAGDFRILKASIADIVTLANYLGWTTDGGMWGGVKSEEAWLAFCRMVDRPPAEFKRIILE